MNDDKFDANVLYPAPLPEPEKQRGRLSPEDAERLDHIHHELLCDPGPISWRALYAAASDEPPLVALRFHGHVVITPFWCRQFWARLHPRFGRVWLGRAAYFNPLTSEVLVKPRHDPLDIEAALLWAHGLSRNPLDHAVVGFVRRHPLRTIHWESPVN